MAAAIAGAALFALALASDFVIGSFWARHAMFTSLLANLLVVVITVAVVNEALQRRDRRRWSLLAQSALFDLVQSARVTWTTMIELLGLAEVESGTVASLVSAAQIALDQPRVSAAVRQLLAAPERRRRLQSAIEKLEDYAGGVIATWASVLVGAAPYAGVLDRHVELQSRLAWLGSVMDHNEPPPDQQGSRRRLTRASVASERAESFDDDWIHDMVLAITVLATRLDYESRDLAFSLVSPEWWLDRTRDLIGA